MDTIKRFRVPILIGLIFVGLAIWAPDTAKQSSQVTLGYFKEMAFIIPPIFVLMGLMEVWIPKDKIQKWLGNKSGIKGAVIAVILGTLPTGPLYVAFPMTGYLLKKGASVFNMVMFLGSWAALKIPQLLVETKFLGIAFTGLRFILTLIFLMIVALIMQFIFRHTSEKEWLKTENVEMQNNKKMKM